jgi:hypothetical protein
MTEIRARFRLLHQHCKRDRQSRGAIKTPRPVNELARQGPGEESDATENRKAQASLDVFDPLLTPSPAGLTRGSIFFA